MIRFWKLRQEIAGLKRDLDQKDAELVRMGATIAGLNEQAALTSETMSFLSRDRMAFLRALHTIDKNIPEKCREQTITTTWNSHP